MVLKYNVYFTQYISIIIVMCCWNSYQNSLECSGCPF